MSSWPIVWWCQCTWGSGWQVRIFICSRTTIGFWPHIGQIQQPTLIHTSWALMPYRGWVKAVKLADQCSLKHVCVTSQSESVSRVLYWSATWRLGSACTSKNRLSNCCYLIHQLLSLFTGRALHGRFRVHHASSSNTQSTVSVIPLTSMGTGAV